MTQRALAETAGISESAVSQYLSGAREPNLRVFGVLCTALGVSPSALMAIGPGEGGDDALSVTQEAAAIVIANAHLLTMRERRSLVDALFEAEPRLP